MRSEKLTLAELAVQLPSQDVEQVSRSGRVSNLHVAVLMLSVKLVGRRVDSGLLVAKLEITLHSARRMFRALSIVTVGKRHDKAGTLEPLGLAGGDELIDDTLSIVGKVTKLGFPHDKCVGRRERVTVFEAETIQY